VGGESAEPVDIADLLDTPEMFEGQLLEVSGTYYNRQVVVCSTRPQRSPATWALSDGEVRISAGGLDERLEELPSGRIELTVIGRWLRWQGPVGCGRQALITEVWYLDLVEVVSPNPITIAAVGSSAGNTSIAGTSPNDPTESPDGYPGPDETESEDPQISATTVVTDTGDPELPQPVGTPVLFPDSTPTIASQTNQTATPTTAGGAAASPTSSTTGSSPTPTGTSSAATASPTTSTGSPAPTSTSGGDGEITIDQERLPPGSLETAELGVNEIHRWPFVVTTTAVITINIASEIQLDATIILRDPSGNVIAEQNNAQDGAPEVLADVPLAQPGTYDILISSESAQPGLYAILVMDLLDDDYYTFIFNGTLEVGQSESIDLRENNDHFWHFYGMAGDTVTIRVTPSDDSNLFLRVFKPDATLEVEFHDETDDGEAEELISLLLPDTGFYSILVGEVAFGSADYTIELVSG
jgi:hypothetical protein